MAHRNLSFHEIIPNPRERLDRYAQTAHPLVFLLDQVADYRNIAGLFRLADAAHAAKIYGYKLPDVTKDKRITRIARQTTNHVPYESLGDIKSIEQLSKTYKPIALEYTTKSIPYHQYRSPAPCMLCIGNEERGLSPEVLSLCSTALHIPMLGINSSMNVTVASGIVTYHLLGELTAAFGA